jgi:lysine-N-methylase
MQGLRWGPESSMEELDCRYREARVRDYLPFMKRHEYVLDNFLISYATRTVFPFGHRGIDSKIHIEYVADSVRRHYLLLAAHYAVVRTLSVGMAAFHGAGFGTEHVVKLVQSYAKTFMHSGSYPAKVFETLARYEIDRASKAIGLFQE